MFSFGRYGSDGINQGRIRDGEGSRDNEMKRGCRIAWAGEARGVTGWTEPGTVSPLVVGQRGRALPPWQKTITIIPFPIRGGTYPFHPTFPKNVVNSILAEYN